MLGHPRTKIRLELREETEIAEPLLLCEQQVDPLGERRLRSQVRPALLADPLRVCRRAEPREGGVEPRLVEAEARGGRGARASGGAERMQELVVLAVLERPREAVEIEERGEVRLRGHPGVGTAPAGAELREDRGAAATVPPQEPLEDRPSFVAAQVVERGRRGRRRRRQSDDTVARAVDDDARRLRLLAAAAPGALAARRGRGSGRRDRLVVLLPRITRLALSVGGRVGGRPAGHVGERVRPERLRRGRIRQDRARGEELLPGQR